MLRHSLFLLLMWVCHCGAGRPNKGLIEGLTLQVPGCNLPPILFPIKEDRNGNVTYGGIMFEPMRWLSIRYNIKYEYIEVDDSIASNLGVYYVESIRMLANREIDLVVLPMPMKWDQLSKVDYSYPNQFEDYLLMQKYPEEKSRLTAILRPFSMTLWMCSIAMIAVFMVVLTIFTISHPEWIESGRQLSVWEHLNHHFEYVAAIVAYQGYYVSYGAGRSFFILCGCWALMMLILTYAYTGNLTSSLVTPTFQPIASKLEDLITLNKKVTAISDTPLAQSFLSAASGTNKIIGDLLRSHPDMIARSVDTATANVLREDACVFIGQEALVRIIIGKNYELQHSCTFTASKPLAYTEQYSFTLTKGNPCRPFIDDSLMIMWQSGLTHRWIDDYLAKVDVCYVKKNHSQSRIAALTLIDLSSAFLFLAFGIGLALVVLMIEKVLFFIQN